MGRHISKDQQAHRGSPGPPGSGFLQTETGEFDLQSKSLCHIEKPSDNGDAINLGVLLATFTALERKVVSLEDSHKFEKRVIFWENWRELKRKVTSLHTTQPGTIIKLKSRIDSYGTILESLQRKFDSLNIK